MKTILSANNLRTGAAWLFLILGIGLYIIGFFYIEENSIWNKIAIKVVDVLVIGVVLGFITNAADFSKTFKGNLSRLIPQTRGKINYIINRTNQYVGSMLENLLRVKELPSIKRWEKMWLRIINGRWM